VEFAKECANPASQLSRSQTLYSMVLQPVIADLPPAGAIAIELDETLWGLTVEALQNSAGDYFGSNHTVIYSPGLLAETALRSPKPLLPHDPMLLVDASQSLGVPLPGHWEEVAAVKHTFANTKTLGPADIKPDEVRHALAQSEEFHFSGHGKREGTGTALLINSDFSLGAGDFIPERLKHLKLAVLSACASGSATKGALDQSNLVRSFLSGGVPSVISSRWDVDSRSTARFMGSFYEHMRSGDSPALAIQRAQADIRSANSHPYYWAAFTLTGRAN